MLPLAAVIVALGAASIADVPSPRPDGWVSDQAHVLGAAGKQQLDGLAERLHADRGIELAVVTVDDVAGTPKQFATALFQRWGIGSAATSNGVLVLLVVGKRRLEIETGRGIEAALTSAWLADMQRDRMVPRFKAGDFRGGLVAGLEAIDEHLRAAPAESSSTAAHGEYRSDGDVVPSGVGSSGSPGSSISPGAALTAPADSPAPAAPTALAATPADSRGGGAAAGGVAAAAGLFALVGGGLLVSRMRRRRRICFQCQPPRTMIALDERADDAMLDAGQRTEEAIGSVDYEVLVCPGCQASRTFRHGRWFSGFDTCAGCSYRTSRSTSQTVIAATYDHGGQIEVTESCVHCKRNHSYTRYTSQLTRPSESSYSSSSSSSSSSYSSSSSSSSGFSGGSSDGGGAGSSW